MAMSGASLSIIGNALNHKDVTTTRKVYAHSARSRAPGAVEGSRRDVREEAQGHEHRGPAPPDHPGRATQSSERDGVLNYQASECVNTITPTVQAGRYWHFVLFCITIHDIKESCFDNHL